MDRKHMSGVLGLLSSQVASRLRITPSAYLSPMVSAMYLRAWCRVRSGHQDLCSISIQKGVSQSINQSVSYKLNHTINQWFNQRGLSINPTGLSRGRLGVITFLSRRPPLQHFRSLWIWVSVQNKDISRRFVYHSLDYKKISWLQYCATILFLVFEEAGESKDGAVVRALAFHQCGSGSNSGVDALCQLSLLLVLSFTPRGFNPGTPLFPSS